MSRTLTLLRFFLSSHSKADLPIAALLIPISLSGAFALLLRDGVTPFAYSVSTLSLSAALVAIPLLGELAYLLRADASSEWIEAQPAAAHEIRAARALHLLVTLSILTILPLLPVALFAPSEMTILDRVLFLGAGLSLSATLAAVLLLIQALLSGRAESIFVTLQTIIVAGVVLGMILGLRHVSVIADIASFEFDSSLALYPPAWFSSAIGEAPTYWLSPALGLLALLLLVSLPRPFVQTKPRRKNILERVLAPARAAASRLWIASDERGPFDFVYDAVPREREVVLRSYPMLGIPLAFLLAASFGEEGAEYEGLMALLLFTPGIYLPILLSQIPASDSFQGRWLLDGAPVSQGAWMNGAIKALAVRFVLPLYLLLGLLAWQSVGHEFALRMAIPGALISLLVLRRLYPTCVTDMPLSIAPDQLRSNLDWGGTLMGWAVVLTLLSVVANRFLSLEWAAAVILCLALMEWLGGRALRRSLG